MEWTPAQGTANQPATIEYPAVVGISHRIESLIYSYGGGTPTTGRITIAVNDVTHITLAVSSAGPGPLTIKHTFPAGAKVTVTLAAGGDGITADLAVEHEAQGRFRPT